MPPLSCCPLQDPAWKPEAYAPEEEEQRDAAWLDKKSAEELEELEEEVGDDRFLAEYRWVPRPGGLAALPTPANAAPDTRRLACCLHPAHFQVFPTLAPCACHRVLPGVSGWRSCAGAPSGRALARWRRSGAATGWRR